MSEELSAQMTIIMPNDWPASNQPLPLLPQLHYQRKLLQPDKSLRTPTEHKDRHKKDRSKLQENKAGKTKGNSGKENHQGRETREVETKVPLPLHKAITQIPATMDESRVVEEEEEGVTQAGNQTEETLLTHKW